MNTRKKTDHPGITKAPAPIIPNQGSGTTRIGEREEREAAERRAAAIQAAEEKRKLKPANFEEWKAYPAWRFYEAAHLLCGYAPCPLERTTPNEDGIPSDAFDPKERDTEPPGSPRRNVALMYDRMKGAADVGELKGWIEGGSRDVFALRKAKPSIFVAWAKDRDYKPPSEFDSLLEDKGDELTEGQRIALLRTMGMLVAVLIGKDKRPNVDPPGMFKDQDELIEHLQARYLTVRGTSDRTLKGYFAEANDALDTAQRGK